jgi:hypothetical protein
LADEDQPAIALREFDRRHKNTTDKHFKRAESQLEMATLERNLANRLSALDSNPPRDWAEIRCRAVVERNLKAPSTAVFQDYSDDYVKYLGQGKFEVQTKVDAENSFGAKLRTSFDCQVQCVDAETCSVTHLQAY